MSPHADDPEVMARMEAFADAACAELRIDRETIAAITPELLGLVGRVAHGAARPAGPMAALLVGIAAARGRDPRDLPEERLLEAMRRVAALVEKP